MLEKIKENYQEIENNFKRITNTCNQLTKTINEITSTNKQTETTQQKTFAIEKELTNDITKVNDFSVNFIEGFERKVLNFNPMLHELEV